MGSTASMVTGDPSFKDSRIGRTASNLELDSGFGMWPYALDIGNEGKGKRSKERKVGQPT